MPVLPPRCARKERAGVPTLRALFAAATVATALASAGEPLTIGYYPAWSVYDRHYLIQQVERSGAAERLDVLAYAFAAIGADDGLTFADPPAELERPYTAADSVDGVADPPDQGRLRGTFNQLRKLKRMHPALRVVLSIGGWNGSARFSDLALDPARRRAFAAACVERAIAGDFAPGLRQPGIFDGLDIDWEYPATAGASAHARSEDAQTFTALLGELRAALDRRGAADGRRYLLTAALPAAPVVYRKLELAAIHPVLDLLMLMAYDFHGSWEDHTGPLAALQPAAGDPLHDQQPCGARALDDYRAAGVPAAKLVLGVPFYGHGWQLVAPGPRGDGMYQAAGGAAALAGGHGVADYRVLARLAGGERHHDLANVSAWSYDSVTRVLWSFDDADTVRAKRAYARAAGLGGVMCWDLGGDDEAGTLIRALAPALPSPSAPSAPAR